MSGAGWSKNFVAEYADIGRFSALAHENFSGCLRILCGLPNRPGSALKTFGPPFFV